MALDEAIINQLSDTCGAFCQSLTRDEVEIFARYTDLVEVGAREVVADIGEVGDHFYLVIGGEIRLFREDAGKEIDVGRIRPGGLVGEMSFFDRLPRTIRLRSRKSGARLLAISRPMYKRLTVEHPFIAVNLLEFVILSLDRIVRSTSADISTLHKQMTGMGYR